MERGKAADAERRRQPRLAQKSAPLLRSGSGPGVVDCSIVEFSAGGARVEAAENVTPGPGDLTIDGDRGPITLAVEVRDVLVEADTGTVSARLVFVDLPTEAEQQLAALTIAHPADARPRTTRRVAVGAGLVVVGLIAAAAVAYAMSTSAAPVRTLTAESALRVVVADDPSQTVVLSADTQSPGAAAAPVQVDLASGPPRSAGQIPVVVTIANHGSRALTFRNRLRATVHATRDGRPAGDVVLSADISEIRPGASATVQGVIELTPPGAYDLDVSVPVKK